VTNAHPFVARVAGRDWAFAHNGYLHGISNTSKTTGYKPAGTMDSEAFFALLINRLNKKGARAAAIAEVTKQFASLGKLNFILSDGNEFYFLAFRITVLLGAKNRLL
jgi:glutamine amidotransferase